MAANGYAVTSSQQVIATAAAQTIEPGGPPEFITASTFLGFCSEGQFTARLNVSEGT